VTSRVPPPNHKPVAASAVEPRTPKRPVDKPKGSTPAKDPHAAASTPAEREEVVSWGGPATAESPAAHDPEKAGELAERATSQEVEKEAHGEQLAHLHEDAEKEKERLPSKVAQLLKSGARPSSSAPAERNFRPQLPSTGLKGASEFSPTASSSARLEAVSNVQNLLAGRAAAAERPPDAFALLKDAREQGVLFIEDAMGDAPGQGQPDSDLAAAVEECIRLCVGTHGILRIGPGRDDKQEPIIVVSATHGFSDASLAKVPEKVHRFATVIAIPFELLPLRRERF
jgi:hypothetical protein